MMVHSKLFNHIVCFCVQASHIIEKNTCTFFGFGFMLHHHMLKDRYIADVVIHYDSISIQLCLKAGEYPRNGHFTKGYMMIIKRLTSQPAGFGDTFLKTQHVWQIQVNQMET